MAVLGSHFVAQFNRYPISYIYYHKQEEESLPQLFLKHRTKKNRKILVLLLGGDQK